MPSENDALTIQATSTPTTATDTCQLDRLDALQATRDDSVTMCVLSHRFYREEGRRKIWAISSDWKLLVD